MKIAHFVVFGLTLTGCADIFGTHDAHAPGEPLGTFEVTANQTANDCGEGTLGSSPTWSFEVDLAAGEGQLFWDSGGETLTGTLSETGAFAFAADVAANLRENGAGPACVVYRHDTASGQLSGDPVTTFSGELGYAFAAQGECDSVVEGPEAMFAKLPCSMSFAMSAALVEAP